MGTREDGNGTHPIDEDRARDVIRLRMAYIRLYKMYLDLQREYETLRTIVDTRIEEN